MFVETVLLRRQEWERFHEFLRYTTDPPAALVATIAWDSGDGEVTAVNVWDTQEAVADIFMERAGPAVATEGAPSSTPEPRGEPLAFYVRH